MKLYRFPYSCYAWKVQALCGLAGVGLEVVDVPFTDRSELLAVSGSMHVPVLVRAGQPLVGSRDICGALLDTEGAFAKLLPAPWEGPIWAYADWVESELEDVLFRLAAPGLRDRFATANERAFYTLIKERKYGPGAVEAWARDADALAAEGAELLGPTARTLARAPFLFGAAPTLADCALYGQLAMLRGGAPARLEALGGVLGAWVGRMRAAGAPWPA